MHIGRNPTFFPIVGFLAIFVASPVTVSAQEEARGGVNSSLMDPAYERIIVAEVGTLKITAQEFLLNYAFGPAFTKREKDSKLRYLQFMINEKLLALDGYARGLQKARRTRDVLGDVEGDLATEELYKHDVAKKVHVTDAEINDGIRKKRISVSIQWLYTPTEAGIAACEKSLRSGAPFDSVYALQLRGATSADDRSLATTQFDLQMKNPVLAKIVDTLALGAVSLPIHVDDGWYIVRVTGREMDAITTETEAVKQREDVHRALVERTSDRLSDAYVNQILVDAHATIERQSFDVLQTYLARSIIPQDRFKEWDMESRLIKRWGPLDVSNIAPFKTQTLVSMRRGKLTIGDFLRWYEARSTGIHLAMTSAPAFFASLEGMVWRTVRDRLLTDRAFQRRYQFTDTVQKQKKWWEEKVLYEMAKSMIADSIPKDTAHLRAYYARHEREFRDTTGTVQPFERVADDVARAYNEDAFTERLLHRILALKSRYTVTVNTAALEGLRVESENDPKAIDVYAVKKGGTFPRPAFPTIDPGWQGWQ